ncbi:hypothetical protein PG996_011021 [Apiospora saccharicola]|uniref:Uncharacterized protein n=1 Tax=Apiospora saccharicola TaxID=335842 RepID=A0ABR1UDW5_9PEZI
MTFVTDHKKTLGKSWSAADLRCAGCQAVERLRKEGIYIDNTDDIIPWNVLATNSYFTGSVGPDPTSRIDGPAQIAGPPQIRAFYNDSFASFESVSKAFANIAEALTLRVRLHGDPNTSDTAREVLNRPALGLVFEQKTCIEVRWPFLAFPAALATLTTAFLVIVIIQSSRDTNATHSWKSSLLPMVFHGFSLDVHHSGNGDGEVGLSNLRDMEGVAKKAMAKLNLEK